MLFGALAIDRREARRGLRWWVLWAPLGAVLIGLVASADGPLPSAQLAFVGLGVTVACTPRRILASEAPPPAGSP